MVYIKKSGTLEYSGDGYSGMDYNTEDQDINFVVIKLNGRIPKTGYQVNTNCKALYYILKGSGVLYNKKNVQEIKFSQGDVIVIDKEECYAFEGDFEAAVSNTPAWTIEQHKYVN